jgi:EAL domain-containing protein (putative c-di-GMP-specific phosphodiesterase class I)
MSAAQPPAGDDDRDATVASILDVVRDHLGMDLAWISELRGGRYVVRASRGRLGGVEVPVGTSTPAEATYCSLVLDGALPPVVPDVRADPRTRDLPVTAELGVGSYLGAPLLDAGGNPVGMLCCLAGDARPGIGEGEARFVQLLARLLGTDVSRWIAARGPVTDRVRDRVLQLIATRAVHPVFQPVLSLHEDRLVGYEALSRADPAHGSPSQLFADAAEVDLGREVELMAVERALEHADELPVGTWLSVNLSPDTLVSPAALDLLSADRHRDLVVELTEHVPVADYGPLLARVDELRALGVGIAVDDAGAGHSSLRHILQLRPDIIKIDIEISRNVHADPVRQALTYSLVRLARGIGALLLAEGVEQQAELDTLARIGVDLAQGYLVAKPGALPGPVSYPTVGRGHRDADVAAVLDRVAAAIVDATDTESLVRPLLDVALEATGMQTAYVTVLDPDEQTLEHRFVRNTGPIQLPEGLTLPWPETLCYRCRQRDIVWSADVPRELPGVALAEQAGVRTYLSLPITDRDGRLAGTLCAGSTDTLFVGEDTLLHLRMLARVVGQHGAGLSPPR